MKDNRFIELLNLYIDRQITVAETTELETEIQRNPARQAVYRQYCHIHSATKLVYDSFRVNATDQPVLADRTGVVELFETKRRWGHVVYYAAGGLAAAACLVLVLARHKATLSSQELMVATNVELHPAAMAPGIIPAATSLHKVFVPAIGAVNQHDNNVRPPDYSVMLAALREQDEELALASRHLQTSHVQSLFDDGLFNASQPLPTQNAKLFRIQQTQAQQVDTTIFQFQR